MAEQQNKDVLRRKEFTFRGQKLEDLKKLEIREFSKLLKSNERRTLLRQYDVIENFIIRCNNRLSKTKLIRTHLRDLVIVPRMIGMRIHVHNGRTFFGVDIVGEMLGHRLGEFAPTRSRVKHGSAGIGATKSSASRSVK